MPSFSNSFLSQLVAYAMGQSAPMTVFFHRNVIAHGTTGVIMTSCKIVLVVCWPTVTQTLQTVHCNTVVTVYIPPVLCFSIPASALSASVAVASPPPVSLLPSVVPEPVLLDALLPTRDRRLLFLAGPAVIAEMNRMKHFQILCLCYGIKRIKQNESHFLMKVFFKG